MSLSLLPSYVSPLSAQAWNSAPALALVRRAVERREAVQADSALTSYRARAHGFVFFLAQVGEGLTEPPRLVKADELDVEVYWKAPNLSKQVILGWRDGTFLPTDINYHRDHLGIVTNNFGDMIRIGDGDEVRDVAHPLSPAGLRAYDYALTDSATIQSAVGRVMVYQIQVRPRSFAEPLVIGTLYLDVASAELVRFRFSFTPPAYLDRQLEDISVVLENALYENRFWLPHRQEIEIRRRATWLDFPARGIIRGRWEIRDYELNRELPDQLFARPAIGGLLRPGTGGNWSQPLAQAIADVAQPVNQQDMETLRGEIERIGGSRVLSGLPTNRMATGSLSDVARVNRVQGLTLGFGGTLGLEGSRLQLRPTIAYGTSDHRLLGSATLTWSTGGAQWSVGAARQVSDFSDLPVTAPLVNSLSAQEAGKDYGDYVLLHSVTLGMRQRLGGRTSLLARFGVEEPHSVTTQASPANGEYRPNPALGGESRRIVRLGLERASGGIAVHRDLQGRVTLEVGEGDGEYVRGTVEGRWLAGLRGSELLSRFYLGVGSDGLPADRSFVLGGRGTLVGEPFRAYGGRAAALGQVEWRFDVPVPALSLGSFASTGRRMTVAPFLAAGYAGRPLPGLPWDQTAGVRPVAGVALEWFMRLIRFEAGVGLRDGHVGVTVDINRDWWGLL
ncbi:MAG TPA: hypothetical protein VGN76_13820 [Gemmatimonadales bacterium]|nr:hypothetical protein [Gemmatimonadales bacterium]